VPQEPESVSVPLVLVLVLAEGLKQRLEQWVGELEPERMPKADFGIA
jgi:hypothetical protein